MDIVIRSARSEDTDAILKLMREFAEFEGLSEYFTTDAERLQRVLFGERRFVEGLVAERGESVIGYALAYQNFASFRGQRGLFLEDLYVSESERGSGAGKALLKAVAKRAAELGCERLDLQVLNWNMNALRFYESLGGVRDEDERHYKFTDDAFRALAGPA
jgi:GNAT superfamily N-acetyltransferase